MKEDLRVCPYCNKSPPYGKVWENFDKHRHDCLKRQHRKQEAAKKQTETPKGQYDAKTEELLRSMTPEQRQAWERTFGSLFRKP